MPGYRRNPARAVSPSKTDYELLAAFRYELRRFLHFSEQAARAAGLHPRQHQAMLAIYGTPERDYLTVGELAERLQVEHHSAVELAKRMLTDGLLAKEADPKDARRVRLRLTPRSQRLLQRLSADHKQELSRVGPALRKVLYHLEQRS